MLGAMPIHRPAGVRLKGSTVRCYLQVIDRDPRRDAIVANLPAATVALVLNPPLATSWVDFAHVTALTLAVESAGGVAAVRDLARKVVDQAKRPHLRILEGVLRLFGASPATVLRRMSDIVKHTIENNQWTYTPTSERSGVMDVRWLVDGEVPSCMFIGATATIQAVLDACGVRGLIGAPERIGPAHARYVIQW
jgi:hypothetical protein